MVYDDKILKKMTPHELLYFILLHNPDKTGTFDIGELEARIELTAEAYPKLRELTPKYEPQKRPKVTNLQNMIQSSIDKGELIKDSAEKNKARLSVEAKRFFEHNLEKQYGNHVLSMYKELMKTIWTEY